MEGLALDGCVWAHTFFFVLGAKQKGVNVKSVMFWMFESGNEGFLFLKAFIFFPKQQMNSSTNWESGPGPEFGREGRGWETAAILNAY